MGVESIGDIKTSFELLLIFQHFYYFNGRLLSTNGLFPVYDEETPPGAKNVTEKALWTFKDTKSHGLVILQFLPALNSFFGESIENSKNSISELHQNLTFKTLSGAIEI